MPTVPSPIIRVQDRLHALRRSHCNTCGCVRCRRIDQLLSEDCQIDPVHPEDDGSWLVEGRLVDDAHGGWALQTSESLTPLNASLSPWAGHHIVVLIGPHPTPERDRALGTE